jgi:hypothetical protein
VQRSVRIRPDGCRGDHRPPLLTPLAEFTRERNQAERELRNNGQREQAEQLKALRKPTAAAAAVNHLVHAHRTQVEAFLQAAATLRDSQVAGKGDLARAAQAEREELEKLSRSSSGTTRENSPGASRSASKPPVTKGAPRRQHEAKSVRPDDGAARRRLQEAKRMLTAATAEERQAQRRWTQAQREVEKAQAAVEKAQHELDRLHTH